MNTEFEDRLRSDMERFTSDVRISQGLVRQAYRHNRKRRGMLRVTAASGAAVAVAASAVAIAGASGAFRPAAAPARTVQTTAYVLRQVERALAPASVGNLISLDRIVFPPGVSLQPAVGGFSGGTATAAQARRGVSPPC